MTNRMIMYIGYWNRHTNCRHLILIENTGLFFYFKIISFRVSIYNYRKVSLQSVEVFLFQLDTSEVSPLMCRWLTILQVTFSETPKSLSRKLNSEVSTWRQLSTELRNEKLHKKCAFEPFKSRKHKMCIELKKVYWDLLGEAMTGISGGLLWAE